MAEVELFDKDKLERLKKVAEKVEDNVPDWVRKKINEKQKDFCVYFIASRGNGAQAALRAGYGTSSPQAQANRMLKKDYVQTYKKILVEALGDHVEEIAEAEEILKFLTATMRGELDEEQVVVVGDGDGVSHPENYTKQVTPKDRISAAKELARIHGMGNAKVEVSGSLPVIFMGEGDLDD